MKDENLFNIFITATEGGINYWADVTKRHTRSDGAEDHVGFRAAVIDACCEDAFPGKQLRVVNRQTIIDGVTKIATDDSVLIGRSLVRKTCRGLLAGGEMEEDAMTDVDAEIADIIVQVGLFGEIVFG